MPKKTNYIVGIILIVLFVNVGSVYFGQKHAKEDQKIALDKIVGSTTEVPVVQEAATTTKNTPVDTKPIKSPALTTGKIAGFYSYANAPHNFSIQYPSYIRPLNSFATFHEIGNNWRLYAGPANQGKSVVSFSIHNIDQGSYFTGRQTYPLYFTAEVRVGVSPNVKECYTQDASQPNQKITPVTINGIAFKKFSTTETFADKYIQSESYRAIHTNACYVIEQIKSGTTLRDPKMSVAVTDAQLTNYYNVGERIVKTFKFTK